jgi:hypothetical protein
VSFNRGWWAAILTGLGAVAAAAFAFVAERREEAPPIKPELMLLTSLPLVFGEQFGLESGGSPALKAIEARYNVRPISVTGAKTLGTSRLLLMAHPLAQPAEMLVDLDRWVRRGGRLLLLADPLLEWPSERPPGDALRPPPAFADTGLLKHWGLRLDAPDERGPKLLTLAGKDVLTGSPGSLFGGCRISKDRLVAHCRIGKGSATIIADADFLNVNDLDGPTADNLNGLLAELATLDQR